MCTIYPSRNSLAGDRGSQYCPLIRTVLKGFLKCLKKSQTAKKRRPSSGNALKYAHSSQDRQSCLAADFGEPIFKLQCAGGGIGCPESRPTVPVSSARRQGRSVSRIPAGETSSHSGESSRTRQKGTLRKGKKRGARRFTCCTYMFCIAFIFFLGP